MHLSGSREILTVGSLADRPAAEDFVGICHIIEPTGKYTITSVSNGVAWHSTGSAATLADRPSAADFGVGVCQVGNDLYRCDGVDYYVAPKESPLFEGKALKKIVSNLMALTNGVTAQPVMMTWGDSVAEYVAGPCLTTLSRKYGAVGYGFGYTATYQSSGTVTNKTGDYTYWPNGTHREISAGSSVTIHRTSGQVFTAKKFYAFLVDHADGGDVTVDVVDASAIVLGTQTVSTNGAVALHAVTITLGSVSNARIKITASTGTAIVVGVYAVDTTAAGVGLCSLGVGGINLVDANSVAHPSILAGVMTILQPAAIFYSMREVSNDETHLADPASWISDPVNGVQALIDKFDAGFASPWILIAPTAAAFDAGLTRSTAPSAVEGAALRDVAVANDYAFFDSWLALGSWEDIVARNNANNDGIHIGAVEQQLLADQFYLYSGWGNFGTYSDRDVRNNTTQSNRFIVTKNAAFPGTGAYLGTNGSGDDLTAFLYRWFDIRHTGGTRCARFSTGAGSDGGAGAIISSGNLSTNINYYEANGDWSIKVDGATGVATLYARVGGVLKSLVLGTLA
jgi:hypothetical protein